MVLPGNVWAEDEGTTTNLEGRVIKYNQAVDPPAGARRDWQIVCDLAKRLGKGQYFPYHVRARDLRRAAHRHQRRQGRLLRHHLREDRAAERRLLALPHRGEPGTPRLYEESFGFADGKARFHPITYLPPAEEPDADYPLVLTTGRVIYHYLSGNQTRRTPFLREQAPYPWVEIHERTADEAGHPRQRLGDGAHTARRADRRQRWW